MVEVKECSFCGSEVEPGTGVLLVTNDGARHYYCSSKCEKNAELGRVPREVEWTKTGEAVASGDEGVEDTQEERGSREETGQGAVDEGEDQTVEGEEEADTVGEIEREARESAEDDSDTDEEDEEVVDEEGDDSSEDEETGGDSEG